MSGTLERQNLCQVIFLIPFISNNVVVDEYSIVFAKRYFNLAQGVAHVE
jgi:hypothetical protein